MNFWERAYVADSIHDIPVYRTGDREMSPLKNFGGGAGVRFALGHKGARQDVVLQLTADGTWTAFDDALYVKNRFSILGTTSGGVPILMLRFLLGLRPKPRGPAPTRVPRAVHLVLPCLAIVAFGIASASCYDPVHDDDVAALGPEAPGVSPGPMHRPGQHCTTCHGGKGPGDPQWSVAGTVYDTLGKPDPAVGAIVTVTDAKGSTRTLTANQVGNFYVSIDDWAPIFPLHIAVAYQDVNKSMVTSIGRDGGCGSCHRGGGDRFFMPAALREVGQ